MRNLLKNIFFHLLIPFIEFSPEKVFNMGKEYYLFFTLE